MSEQEDEAPEPKKCVHPGYCARSSHPCEFCVRKATTVYTRQKVEPELNRQQRRAKERKR